MLTVTEWRIFACYTAREKLALSMMSHTASTSEVSVVSMYMVLPFHDICPSSLHNDLELQVRVLNCSQPHCISTTLCIPVMTQGLALFNSGRNYGAGGRGLCCTCQAGV